MFLLLHMFFDKKHLTALSLVWQLITNLFSKTYIRMNILTHLSADDSILLNSDHQDIASHQDVISHDVINPLVTSSNPRDIINPLVTTSQQLLSHQMHRPLLDSMSQNMTSSMSCERRAAELSSYNSNNPATDDERVVQAILISHDGPQTFPQFKDNQHQQLGLWFIH